MKKALRRSIGLVSLILLPTAAFAAGPVTVKGKVAGADDLLNPVWNEAKELDKHRFNFREPASTVPEKSRVLRGNLSKELCIAVIQDKGAPLNKPIRVLVEGGRTSPVTLVIAPGQELDFENNDPFTHNIYEVSGKAGFAENEMPPMKARKWTPPGPGKYEIRDKLAPSLRSWVVVDPGVIKTVYPNRKGEFQAELDPGTYTLRAYFNGQAVGDTLSYEAKVNPATQELPNPLKVGAAKDDKPDPKKDDGKKGGG